MTQPVARQRTSAFGPHPRRPFDVRGIPPWASALRWRYALLFLALWPLAALSWPLAAGRPDGLLRLTVLTPGDTVVVRTPHGERMVVGGGSWASDTNAEADWGRLPWERRLGVVAATRLDRPTLDALNEVLARHQTRAAIAPPLPRTAAGQTWTGLVQAQGATALRVDERLPMSLTLDGVTLDILAYDEVEKATLYGLRWGEVRFVLGGGLRGPVELTPTPASVVLVSRQARLEWMTALARAYRPALWVVQTDGDGDVEAPDWMDRLPSVLADRPTTLTTDGERLWIEREP